MASTDRSAAADTPVYLVPDWVRVRREDFGLLFYDTRSTRLTFVRSGDRLVPPPFTGARRVLRVRRRRVRDGCAPARGPSARSRVFSTIWWRKGLLVAAEAE